MLEAMRRIIQEVNSAKNLDQALNLIVCRIKQVMKTDVCSIYLSDIPNHKSVLMATDGLKSSAVGNVRLDLSEGLIGLVTSRAEPLNVANAPAHPQYLYLPDTGEEKYFGFLCVPIVHHRKVLGVISVQQAQERTFKEEELTLLVTLAAQLAGAIAHAEAIGDIAGLHEGIAVTESERPIRGLPGSSGVSIGCTTVIYPPADLEAVPVRKTDNPDAEIKAFLLAVEATKKELRNLKKRVEQLPEEDQVLFEAYLMMLESKTLINKTVERIRHGFWASTALKDTVLEHIHLFSSMEDEYLRERAQDIRDLGRRILMHLQSRNRGEKLYHAQTILVGHEVTASDLMEVPEKKLAGLVCATGSGSSHVAILARALGIPAVMGAVDLPVNELDGKTLVVDGYQGSIYVEPSNQVMDEFSKIIQEENELSADLRGLVNLPSETSDGIHIPLHVNSGLLSDLPASQNSGAEGIGLYRTEFPFMIRDRFPSEDEQCKIYRQVLESFAPNPVTLRTLDIGGDKNLAYFPISEENPFLGWRGIRISLDHPDIFATQLKGMLLASAGLNNLNILLPMISSVSEVRESIQYIHKAHKELIEDGHDNIITPKIGVMIEVPSAVYQIDRIVALVDFISIGTNDLVQYILAVDRNNPNVADLYDCLHPSVITAVKQVIQSAAKRNVTVSVCGEMAGDPASALLLLGMGLNMLSMNVVSLLKIKWVIRSFSFEEARQLLDEVEKFDSASEVRAYLNNALFQAGLGGLIRPGKH